jgi:hypothetical protein
VASSQSVSSRQGDDLLVVETKVATSGSADCQTECLNGTPRLDSPHPVENVSQVVLSLGSVRQPTIGSAVVVVSVNSTGPPRYNRSSRLLDGTDTTESPQVSIRDPRELLLDLLHVVSSDSLIRGTKECTSGLSGLKTRNFGKRSDVLLTRPLLAP